jgi:uncharacterized membrane protein
VSIDLLRGVAIVVMTLDHVRDFVHSGAMVDSPTNLQTTTSLLFATRWITHFCAPAFALLAGLGAWLWWSRGRTRAELSRFLLVRGLLLILLELLVMQFAYAFSFPATNTVFLLVLWSLGVSMIGLAALIWLPLRVLAPAAVATMLLYPLLSLVVTDPSGAGSLWSAIVGVGLFQIGSMPVISPYPIIPWVAVMAFGFCLGPLFAGDAAARRRWLLAIGSAAVAGFVILRLLNTYVDPAPWRWQATPMWTLLSFLNTTKYPASPAFLLMTIGPVLLFLAAAERLPAGMRVLRPLQTFGRVSLFYYVVHFYCAHFIATGLAFARYGPAAFDFATRPYPSFGGDPAFFPGGFGYGLPVVYAVWLAVLALCFPLCRIYDRLKARRSGRWLAYL